MIKLTKKKILGYLLLAQWIPIAALIANIIRDDGGAWWAVYLGGWIINIIALAFWGLMELCVYLIRDEND